MAAGAEVARVSVIMFVSPEQGAAGTIGIFSDPQASGCNLFDQGSGLVTAYVVHVLTSGASGSQFAAPMPPCMRGVTYLGEASAFPVTLGTTQTGVSIGYGSCYSGTILLLTVRFFGTGQSDPCCVYPVVSDADGGQTEIIVVDCVPSFLFSKISLGIPANAPCLQADARAGDTHTHRPGSDVRATFVGGWKGSRIPQRPGFFEGRPEGCEAMFLKRGPLSAPRRPD
jgi:hypothetical protein